MLRRYLKSRRLGTMAFFLFSGVFVLVFTLCDLPVDAVGYALLICCTLGVALLTVDYTRFYRHCVLLDRLKANVEEAADALPAPRGEIEACYQAMLVELRKRQLQNDLARRERYAEHTDYYTLWAHQVKTPLAAMQLILQDRDDADAQELRVELRRVEQYVDMVLCYIRLNADATDYLFRRCSLDNILRGELRLAAGQFIRGRIALEYPGTDYIVLTDEKWLGFVIGQILSNALKYTPAGGRISIHLEDEVLCIRDSGVGIPPEDLPRVTQSGFTGRNGRDGRGASGLGLYLCRRVLERLGHSLEIRSTRGEGTEVRIDLSAARLKLD